MAEKTTPAEPAPRRTRNRQRTRREVLDAAARMVESRGAGISLAMVASEANLSKSGLLHHFASREELIDALIEDTTETFRTKVLEHLDDQEQPPGRMLRAYVRALCTPGTGIQQYFGSSPLWNGLQSAPRFVQMMKQDAQWWTEQFLEDGLDPSRVEVVRRAAEGIAAASAYGEVDTDHVTRFGQVLLAMTEQDHTDSPSSIPVGARHV